MPGKVQQRLGKKGVNVDFLIWLEGKEQRLPSSRAVFKGIRTTATRHLQSALKATVLLRALSHSEGLVPKDEQEAWFYRYSILREFLLGILEERLLGQGTDEDFGKLRDVLEACLGEEAASPYLKDLTRTAEVRKADRSKLILRGDYTNPTRRSGSPSTKENREWPCRFGFLTRLLFPCHQDGSSCSPEQPVEPPQLARAQA